MEASYHSQIQSPYFQFEQVPKWNAWNQMSYLCQQGVRNIEIAIWPQDYLSPLEATQCDWQQRVKHIVVGALLCIPLVHIITYLAVRYFAQTIEIMDDPEELEEAEESTDIQEIEEVEEFSLLKSPLEQNVDLLIKELANAKERRSMWTMAPQITYNFELQINSKGQIYTIKDTSFFPQSLTTRNVEHQKLYTIDIRFFASNSSTPDKAFKINPQTNQSLSPALLQMLDDLAVQLNETAEKIMEKLPPMTTDEAAEWLVKNLGQAQSEVGVWKFILRKEPLWNVILHKWDKLQHLFVKQST